jgi:hypothetical protein
MHAGALTQNASIADNNMLAAMPSILASLVLRCMLMLLCFV